MRVGPIDSNGSRFRVLRHTNVRRYFVGYVSSNFGTSMANVALAFAVLDGGGDATDLGLVFTSQIIVQIALMIGGGVIADRLGRRRVMLGADLLRTGCQGLLAVALFAGHPAIWVFIVLVSLGAAGGAVFEPAFNGLIVDIAPSEEVGDANALFSLSQSAAKVAGPAAAGVLIAVVHSSTVIALDAASFAISAIALAGLKLPPRKTHTQSSMFADLAEGWDTFRSRTWLWTITLYFSLFNLLSWGPLLLLGPVLAKEDLSGARSWGAILTAYALGSVLGGLVALGQRPKRPLLIAALGTFAYPIPLALFALNSTTVVIAIGTLVAGIGSATFNIFFNATVRREIPAEMQARVSAFDLVGAYSAGPIAFAAAGPVSVLIGAHTVLTFGAAWTLLSSLILIAVPSIRDLRWTTAHESLDANHPTGSTGGDRLESDQPASSPG